jgi:hypothetical protein
MNINTRKNSREIVDVLRHIPGITVEDYTPELQRVFVDQDTDFNSEVKKLLEKISFIQTWFMFADGTFLGLKSTYHFAFDNRGCYIVSFVGSDAAVVEVEDNIESILECFVKHFPGLLQQHPERVLRGIENLIRTDLITAGDVDGVEIDTNKPLTDQIVIFCKGAWPHVIAGEYQPSEFWESDNDPGRRYRFITGNHAREEFIIIRSPWSGARDYIAILI